MESAYHRRRTYVESETFNRLIQWAIERGHYDRATGAQRDHLAAPLNDLLDIAEQHAGDRE